MGAHRGHDVPRHHGPGHALHVRIDGQRSRSRTPCSPRSAHDVFGGGFLFILLQFFTAGILILAANTAFQDFPRLSSILARDRFMPSQFRNRGDRLVFSNGVIVLAGLAMPADLVSTTPS